MNTPLLQIKNLHTDIEVHNGMVRALLGVGLHVNPGETLGIVGESGSGKTMTALSLMGLFPRGGRVSSGPIILDGQDLIQLSPEEKRKLHGMKVGIIFQDPFTSLNPTMKIGLQICGPLHVHEKLSKREALTCAVETLKRVDMFRPEVVINNYPHQFSGGIRRRVMIAMALVCRPRIPAADEPATALDVTAQIQVLDLIGELRDEYKTGAILIAHNLSIVVNHADHVAVMYAGRIIETAPTKTLFTGPKHRYTSSFMVTLPERVLAAGTKFFSIPDAPPSLTNLPVGYRFAACYLWATDKCRVGYPDLNGDETHTFSCFHPVQGGDEPPAVLQGKLSSTRAEEMALVVPQISHEVLLDVKEASHEYKLADSGFFKRKKNVVSAADRVSITVKKGETYDLIGESGCGRPTVGHLIAGLEPPSGDAIELGGRDLATLKGRGTVRIHRDIWMMFQDSYATIDPRMRTDQVLAEPISIQKTGNARQIAEHITEILEQVGFIEEILDRYPYEFSGGQLQRAGFARPLALAPNLVVADEPVSVLDVSVQAQALNLMRDLQQGLGLPYLFINHDLAAVQYVIDRIDVIYLGCIVEEDPVHEAAKNPKYPHTKALTDSIPVPGPGFKHNESVTRLTGEPPSVVNPPEGCRFRPRCLFTGEEYRVQSTLADKTYRVAYHHPFSMLSVKEDVSAQHTRSCELYALPPARWCEPGATLCAITTPPGHYAYLKGVGPLRPLSARRGSLPDIVESAAAGLVCSRIQPTVSPPCSRQ